MKNSEKELKKLSRSDLLEMLIEQSKEVDRLKAELKQANAALENRRIAIENAGSIAEASMKLSGIFEAAQQAADMYLDNVRRGAYEAIEAAQHAADMYLENIKRGPYTADENAETSADI